MNLPAHKRMLSAAAAASVLLITAACGSSGDNSADASTPAATSTAPSTEAPSTDAPDSASTGAYTDGEYEAEGSYANPGGVSAVKVDVKLAAGKITAVTVTPEATDGTSRRHQEDFAGGIADVVVGKSIDELDVTKVAGSSLTSEGFNQAIDAIKDEAKA